MSVVQPAVSSSGDALVGDGVALSEARNAPLAVDTRADVCAGPDEPQLSPNSQREASQQAARAEIQNLVESNPLQQPVVRTPTNFAARGGGAMTLSQSGDLLPTVTGGHHTPHYGGYSTGRTSPSLGRRTPRSSDGRRSPTGRRGSAKRRRSSLFRHDKHSLVGPVHSEEKATLQQRVWALVDEPGSSVAVSWPTLTSLARFVPLCLRVLMRCYALAVLVLAGSLHCHFHHGIDWHLVSHVLLGDAPCFPQKGR